MFSNAFFHSFTIESINLFPHFIQLSVFSGVCVTMPFFSRLSANFISCLVFIVKHFFKCGFFYLIFSVNFFFFDFDSMIMCSFSVELQTAVALRVPSSQLKCISINQTEYARTHTYQPNDTSEKHWNCVYRCSGFQKCLWKMHQEQGVRLRWMYTSFLCWREKKIDIR